MFYMYVRIELDASISEVNGKIVQRSLTLSLKLYWQIYELLKLIIVPRIHKSLCISYFNIYHMKSTY